MWQKIDLQKMKVTFNQSLIFWWLNHKVFKKRPGYGRLYILTAVIQGGK